MAKRQPPTSRLSAAWARPGRAWCPVGYGLSCAGAMSLAGSFAAGVAVWILGLLAAVVATGASLFALGMWAALRAQIVAIGPAPEGGGGWWPPPGPEDPGGEPPWWPAFEADLERWHRQALAPSRSDSQG